MPDRAAYHRTIASARRVGLSMTDRQLREFVKLLEEYADQLSTRVSMGFARGGEIRALREAREIIADLTRAMATSTRSNVVLTARDVARIHAQATTTLVEGTGIAVNFGGIGTTAAQAVLTRPELAASFRTIRRESIGAVDRILKRAMVRSASNDAIARELRLHVLGADEFPARLLLDRRRIGYEAIRELGYEPTRANLDAVRKDAGRIADKARLIARTEPMNAEAEATIQAAIDSPVVKAIRWQLSHRHEVRDVCDVLAEVDWYGLGPGHYDPRRCPPRPHPRCLCVLFHVLRPVEEWGRFRPELPSRLHDVDEVGEEYGLYPSQIAALSNVLDIAEGRFEEAA